MPRAVPRHRRNKPREIRHGRRRAIFGLVLVACLLAGLIGFHAIKVI